MTEQFYSTGQFAKLCGVKKQTLFHYDDIGLLCPVDVANNGYRQYSYRQYETFLLITCLKEAGMSLKEIKAFLALGDDETRSARIAEVMRTLDGRIEHLVNVKRVLASTFGAAGSNVSGDTDEPDTSKSSPSLPKTSGSRGASTRSTTASSSRPSPS